MGDTVTVTYTHQSESCHGQALQLVELVRSHAADISHSGAQDLLRDLLASLAEENKDLNVLVPRCVLNV